MCALTTRSMREVAERCVQGKPERLVLLTPHAPRRLGRWGAWATRIRGDLGAFGATDLQFELPVDDEALQRLEIEAELDGPVDHGAAVPLAFLVEAGWRGKTLVLSPPAHLADASAMGEALAALAGPTALIASGDMSHRLREGAPAGYHPDAKIFDNSFVAALRRDDWRAALEAEPRRIAAEDVVDTSSVVMEAAQQPLHAEVLSYEAPWGVGYTVAVLNDPTPPLYAIARKAVCAHVLGQPYSPPDGGPPACGLFVTIRKEGSLRGCSGRLRARWEGLHQEVEEMAISSATRDPRFPPVTEEELPNLHYSISLLGPLEKIPSAEVLDPRSHGVVVRSGSSHGVLLPNVPGVKRAKDAICIAMDKAGIESGAPYELLRFQTTKVEQP